VLNGDSFSKRVNEMPFKDGLAISFSPEGIPTNLDLRQGERPLGLS
jgi:hypothetical protein